MFIICPATDHPVEAPGGAPRGPATAPWSRNPPDSAPSPEKHGVFWQALAILIMYVSLYGSVRSR